VPLEGQGAGPGGFAVPGPGALGDVVLAGTSAARTGGPVSRDSRRDDAPAPAATDAGPEELVVCDLCGLVSRPPVPPACPACGGGYG
jgi:hypothetical protein